jgi:hypothetical protein
MCDHNKRQTEVRKTKTLERPGESMYPKVSALGLSGDEDVSPTNRK